MSGTPNPIDTVIVDGIPVSKSDFRSYEKTYVRKVIGSVSDIANGDWAGQFGGLHLVSDNSDWDIDTDDTTTPNDDDHQRDANGIMFIRVASIIRVPTRTYTDSDIDTGAITLDNNFDRHFINTSSSVDVNVPAADDRSGRDVYIKDIGGHGFTPVLDGSETIDGAAASGYEVTTAKGWLTLAPTTGGYLLINAQL